MNCFVRTSRIVRLGWLGVWLLGNACQQAPFPLELGLQSPTGMAVVIGDSSPYPKPLLAVLNGLQGTLQFVQLASVQEGAQHQVIQGMPPGFPLQLPVGPFPVDVAALADGRWLVVGDGLRNDLLLIDGIRQVIPEQTRLSLAFTQIRQILPLPDCGGAEEGCFAQLVVLGGPGEGAAIVQVRRLGHQEVPELIVQDYWLVGQTVQAVGLLGEDGALAVILEQGRLLQVWLRKPQLQPLPNGTLILPAAMDGLATWSTQTLVAVVSRLEKSIWLYELSPSPIGDSSVFVAKAFEQEGLILPRCLSSCDGPSLCQENLQPFEPYCLNAQGLQRRSDLPTHRFSLGGTPQTILPIALTPEPIGDGCLPNQSFTDGLVVLLADGRMQLLGVTAQSTVGATPSLPRLLRGQQCTPPTLRAEQPTEKPALTPCQPSNLGATIYPCLQDQVGGEVAWLRGAGTTLNIQAQLAGPVPLAKVREGGIVDSQGRFSDTLRDIAGLGLADESTRLADGSLYGGDILEILSQPLGGVGCLLAAGESTSCAQRYRIVAKEIDGEGRTWLRCDRPIPAACYPSNGLIAYNVVTQNVLAVTVQTDGVELGFTRVPLGTRIGLGTPFFANLPGSLGFRPGLLERTQETYCGADPMTSRLRFSLTQDGYDWQTDRVERWTLQDPSPSIYLDPRSWLGGGDRPVAGRDLIGPYQAIQVRSPGLREAPIAISYPGSDALGLWTLGQRVEDIQDPSAYQLLR